MSPVSAKAREILIVAMADKKSAKEIADLIDALVAANAALAARVTALENA